MKAKPTVKQNLSKNMKKQGHTGSKKPSNKKLDAEKSLAEKPKKGTHREPNSKKLSSETSLQKSHKLVHLKEFNSFEDVNEYFGGSELPAPDFNKLAKEYLHSEEAENESWGNEECRAIEVFAKWLNEKFKNKFG
jgi:hypothetical protein